MESLSILYILADEEVLHLPLPDVVVDKEQLNGDADSCVFIPIHGR